jgi:hypothetical protein
MTEATEGKSSVVYISISRKNFGQRFKAMKMATERKMVPVYPGIVSDLAQIRAAEDRESRDRERLGQIKKASEVWVVGEISREMTEDIELAKRLAKKIRYFEPAQAGADLRETDAADAKKERFF